MSKVLATLAAGLFAASLSVYAVAADTAKADYKAAKAACAKLSGAEKSSCEKDAKAKNEKAEADTKATYEKAEADAKAMK